MSARTGGAAAGSSQCRCNLRNCKRKSERCKAFGRGRIKGCREGYDAGYEAGLDEGFDEGVKASIPHPAGGK